MSINREVELEYLKLRKLGDFVSPRFPRDWADRIRVKRKERIAEIEREHPTIREKYERWKRAE